MIRRLGVLLAIGFIIVIYFLYAQKERSFAEITLSQAPGQTTVLETTHYLKEINGAGEAFFEFDAFAANTANQQLIFTVHPDATAASFPQKKEKCCSSGADGKIKGTVQLASSEYPLHHDEKYTFSLTDSKNKPIMNGNIHADVYVKEKYTDKYIAMIAVISSLLSIVAWLWPELGLSNRRNGAR
jgi:hypothetical protein